MKTLDEQWDGATYYIKAEMTVDPKDLERRIAEVLNDKQKTKEYKPININSYEKNVLKICSNGNGGKPAMQRLRKQQGG
jgi:hypothetical protein